MLFAKLSKKKFCVSREILGIQVPMYMLHYLNEIVTHDTKNTIRICSFG